MPSENLNKLSNFSEQLGNICKEDCNIESVYLSEDGTISFTVTSENEASAKSLKDDLSNAQWASINVSEVQKVEEQQTEETPKEDQSEAALYSFSASFNTDKIEEVKDNNDKENPIKSLHDFSEELSTICSENNVVETVYYSENGNVLLNVTSTSWDEASEFVIKLEDLKTTGNVNVSRISTEANAEGNTVYSFSATLEIAEFTEIVNWPEGGKDAFLDHALPIMGLGMLGIFIVLGLIAIATISINKLFPAKKKGKED